MIPHVASRARCLAPDLVGMGESGKPDIAYRLADHVRYLDAWFDAMSLHDAVLVGHDWGGTLAMDWGARHPVRVRGIAVMETFLRPVRSEELAPPVAGLFHAYRSPKGEKMIMEDNMVIEVNLARSVAGGLAAADLDVYRAPFRDPVSRTPMLAWTREAGAGAAPDPRVHGVHVRSGEPASVLPLRPAGTGSDRHRPRQMSLQRSCTQPRFRAAPSTLGRAR